MHRSHHLILPVVLASLGCFGGLASADTGVAPDTPAAAATMNDAMMEEAFTKEERLRARLVRLQSLHDTARRTRDAARLRDAERQLVTLHREHRQVAEARRKQLGAEGEARFEEGLKRRAELRAKRKAALESRRGERHEWRAKGRGLRQDARGERRDLRQDARTERRDTRQGTRADRKQQREDRRDARKDAREDRHDTRKDAREDRHDTRKDAREERRDTRKDVRQSRRGRKKK